MGKILLASIYRLPFSFFWACENCWRCQQLLLTRSSSFPQRNNVTAPGVVKLRRHGHINADALRGRGDGFQA